MIENIVLAPRLGAARSGDVAGCLVAFEIDSLRDRLIVTRERDPDIGDHTFTL